jgi:hypothetical protein
MQSGIGIKIRFSGGNINTAEPGFNRVSFYPVILFSSSWTLFPAAP